MRGRPGFCPPIRSPALFAPEHLVAPVHHKSNPYPRETRAALKDDSSGSGRGGQQHCGRCLRHRWLRAGRDGFPRRCSDPHIDPALGVTPSERDAPLTSLDCISFALTVAPGSGRSRSRSMVCHTAGGRSGKHRSLTGVPVPYPRKAWSPSASARQGVRASTVEHEVAAH